MNTVCAYLDANPTIDALHELSYAGTYANLGRGTIGRVVHAAVSDVCPRHMALTLAWASS